MKQKMETEVVLKKTALGALVACVVLISVGSFYSGSSIMGHTETVAQTTILNTETQTTTVTTTSLTWQYATVTSTNLITATYFGPDNITIGGFAKASGIGQTANQIEFVNVASLQTIKSPITSGSFSIVVPNRANYAVKIDYSGPVGGVGSGSCTSAGLVLFAVANSVTANFSC